MRHFYYTEKRGADLICDGCGNSVFLKRIKERTYSEDEIYEKPPKGWAYDGNHTRVYCPECSEKIRKYIAKVGRL